LKWSLADQTSVSAAAEGRDMTGRTIAGLAILTLAAWGALAAPASASRIYAGEPVSQRLQVVLDVSDDGTALQGLTFFLDLPCTRTARLLDMGTARPVAALPAQPTPGSHLLAGGAVTGGRVSATLLTSRARGDALMDVARGELTGTMTASEARGTLVARRTVVERSTGRVLGSCSKTLRWRAVRGPGTVFGGRTSAGAPVVLRVTRDHRRVTRSLISWAAPCRRASYYIEPHDKWLLPFAVSRGGRFDERYRYDAGAGGAIIGRFAGRVRENRASGVFESRFQSRRDRCGLRPQTWTATSG
jgi:hypothetical protein